MLDLGPFVALPLYALMGSTSFAVLAPWLLLPLAIRLERVVATRRNGHALNDALAGTARLGFAFCVLFAVGWAFA